MQRLHAVLSVAICCLLLALATGCVETGAQLQRISSAVGTSVDEHIQRSSSAIEEQLLDGCEDPRSVVILIDTTRSYEAIRAEVPGVVEVVVENLRPLDHLYVAEIRSDSLVRSALVVDETIGEYYENGRRRQTPNQLFLESVVASQSAEIVERVRAHLADAQFESSDPLSALRLCEQLVHEGDLIVMCSDGRIDFGSIRFSEDPPSPESASSMVESLAASGQLPRLSGVQLLVYGADAETVGAYDGIRAFWLAVADESGIELLPEHYGRHVPREVIGQFVSEAH